MSENSRHDRLGSTFLKARELDAAGRAAFLSDLRASDAEMADWVGRMLDAESKSAPLLDQSSSAGILGLVVPDIVGARIGRYAIKRRIGAGGMGAVYEAVQDKPHRSVAIKILPAGLGSRIAARRFEYESDVLARLRHPAIAQVYEVGIHSEQGIQFPFFAMEYVADAQPITAYAKGRGLSMRAVIELFNSVCVAVHHGHQRGVIHRDLKPDNILVDAGGHPKIIDFGVARAIDRSGQAVTLQTQSGQLIGTVPYMSPEQVGGDPAELDIRTDVYSLGVVLFELVTGRLPQDVTGVSLTAAIRMIRENAPSSAARINPRVPGDLDRIIGKALARACDERYASAAELSADLTRFMRDEPVAARPPTVAYQLRKFAKRNRGLVAATVVLLLTLLGGVVAERRRANEAIVARNEAIAAKDEADIARKKAQVESARSNRVVRFLDNMFSKVTPDGANGKQVTVQEALDAAAADIAGELSDSPEVEATLRSIIGGTYLAQGLYPQAKTMLTGAAAIHERLGLRTPETAKIHETLGAVLVRLSEFDAALDEFGESLEIARQVDGTDGDMVLDVLTQRGEVLYRRGQFEEVVDTLQSVIDIRLRRGGESDPEIPDTRANLAMVFKQLGRFDEAAGLLNQALAWHRENDGATNSTSLEIQDALAGVRFSQGHVEDAIAISSELIGAYREHFGPDHPALAESLFTYGTRLLNSRRFAEAESPLQEALRIDKKVYGSNHVAVGRVLGRLSAVVQNLGRLDEALAMQRRALDMYEAASETDTVNFAWALHEHANSLLAAKRCEEALAVETRAVDLFRRLFGDGGDGTLKCRHLLALIEIRCGDIEKGVKLTEAVLADRRRILPAGHPDIAISTLNLGRAFRDAGRMEEAVTTLNEAADLYSNGGPADQELRIGALGDIALMLQVLDRSGEAVAVAESVETWSAAHDAPEGPDRILAICNLANALMSGGNWTPVSNLMLSVDAAGDMSRIEDDRIAGIALLSQGRWLARLGRDHEAGELFVQSRERLAKRWGPAHSICAWAARVSDPYSPSSTSGRAHPGK